MTDGPTRAGAAGAAGPRLLALLDYDGTMTTHECNEVALQPFVGDEWWDARGGVVQRPHEPRGVLRPPDRPDPGAAGGAHPAPPRGGRAHAGPARRSSPNCRPAAARPAIVSAGIREAIEAFWAREELPPIELFASELVGEGPEGGPPYHLEFSDALGDCPRCGPKSCKAAVLRRLRRPGDVVLVFGDGPSDLCPAREADLVFARGHLAERCEQEGLEWRPLTDFGAVLGEVDDWLARR